MTGLQKMRDDPDIPNPVLPPADVPGTSLTYLPSDTRQSLPLSDEEPLQELELYIRGDVRWP